MQCPLSKRELQVVEQLSTGAPAKVVADRLGTTQASVQGYVRRALGKIPAGNAVGLVATAIRNGWVQ